MEALDRLKRKLGIELNDNSNDETLNDYLSDAEDAIKLFLNVEELDSIFTSTQIRLAKIYADKDKSDDVKSESHSEGPVSESFTYKTFAEYEEDEDKLLDSLKRYRRAYVRHKKENTPEV